MKRISLLLSSLVVLTSVVAAQQQPQGQQQRQGGAGQAAGQGGGGRGQADPRDMGGGSCNANPYNCADAPNPLRPPDTVFLEELTWMDVRDVMKAGKTTMIITTGGIEPNGPWIALGKHNWVLKANCDAIARKLGNALCAPNIPFVPEGDIDPPTTHMRSPGTISLTEASFQALLTDIVRSFKTHGFQNIILIGDSGGNQKGMAAVAQKLNAEWNGSPVVAHIPEYYDYPSVGRLLNELGVTKAGQPGDSLHDDPGITMNIMVADPKAVRTDERIKIGKATIDGVSIADKAKAIEIGKKIVEMRATKTVEAIQKKIASKGK
jgi:creatinine amidohydrolase/Fe(II)-dependent formamide hydrolase-like protein